MKILYLSSMFDDEIIEKIYDKGKSPNFAANKYHQLLSVGLAENGVKVNTYSTLPISGSHTTKRYIKVPVSTVGNLTKEYISVFNFRAVKHLMLFIKSFFKVLFSAKDTVVIYDVLVIPSSMGALLACKLRGLKALSIVTDLPDFMHADTKKLKRAINNKLLTFADGFVFLTEQMNEALNPSAKPYIVLEGHVDVNMQTSEHKPFSEQKKIVIYAGGIQRMYGISNLTESFLACCKDNEQLHIYGDGDYMEELTEIAGNSRNVIYHGCRPNKEIVDAELSATLLVNPRSSEGEYTKYSFPSKTLEYMVSGTPVLTAKLPGIPDDYDEYVYYFDDMDRDGLKKSLRSVLDKSCDELSAKGSCAKQYVLSCKNNVKRAGEIIDFVRQNLI